MKLDYYLLKYADLKALHELVRRDFSTLGLIHHNWNHVMRDLARAITIGEKERAHMKIALAGVLLHDIGRLYPEADEDHYVAGRKIAPMYLTRSGFAKDEIDGVVHCVEAHGPRGLKAPETIEAKVCYDVDVLSCSVGNLGVARVFDFFMREEKMGVKDMVEIPSGRKGPRKDFYTATGKTIGQKGLKKARKFWEELNDELKEEERTVRKTIPDYEGD
jgi:HD superfamily phosphodiesterase